MSQGTIPAAGTPGAKGLFRGRDPLPAGWTVLSRPLESTWLETPRPTRKHPPVLEGPA